LLNVSKDIEQWKVIPEGEKPTQDMKGEMLGYEE